MINPISPTPPATPPNENPSTLYHNLQKDLFTFFSTDGRNRAQTEKAVLNIAFTKAHIPPEIRDIAKKVYNGQYYFSVQLFALFQAMQKQNVVSQSPSPAYLNLNLMSMVMYDKGYEIYFKPGNNHTVTINHITYTPIQFMLTNITTLENENLKPDTKPIFEALNKHLATIHNLSGKNDNDNYDSNVLQIQDLLEDLGKYIPQPS